MNSLCKKPKLWNRRTSHSISFHDKLGWHSLLYLQPFSEKAPCRSGRLVQRHRASTQPFRRSDDNSSDEAKFLIVLLHIGDKDSFHMMRRQERLKQKKVSQHPWRRFCPHLMQTNDIETWRKNCTDCRKRVVLNIKNLYQTWSQSKRTSFTIWNEGQTGELNDTRDVSRHKVSLDAPELVFSGHSAHW